MPPVHESFVSFPAVWHASVQWDELRDPNCCHCSVLPVRRSFHFAGGVPVGAITPTTIMVIDVALLAPTLKGNIGGYVAGHCIGGNASSQCL